MIFRSFESASYACFSSKLFLEKFPLQVIRSEVNFLVPRPVTEMVFSDLFRFLMALPNKPSPMMKPNEATAMAIMFLFINCDFRWRFDKFKFTKNYTSNSIPYYFNFLKSLIFISACFLN